MRVTPFPAQGRGHSQGAMGSVADLLPQTHVLFVGPMQCARHAFSALATRANTSTLVVTDVETALGQTEQRIAEAVAEIAACEPDVRAFVLLTACQTAFLGIDFLALCRTLHERTGLCFAHVEMNRMDAANIPGPTRKNVPGGDRFHTRLRLFGMLEQREPAGPGGGAATTEALDAPGDGAASGAVGTAGNARVAGGVDATGGLGALGAAGGPATPGGRGLLVLADEGAAPASDLRDYLLLQGIEWVRAVPDFEDFGQFLQCRDAAAVVVTSMQWKETGEYLQQRFGIPALYLPVGYALEEVEDACAQLDAALWGCGTPGQWGALHRARAQRRVRAQEGARRALQACPSFTVDLSAAQRPFSLVEALLGYGFDVQDFSLAQMRIVHKEDDDAPAFQRLKARYPQWMQRFENVERVPRDALPPLAPPPGGPEGAPGAGASGGAGGSGGPGEAGVVHHGGTGTSGALAGVGQLGGSGAPSGPGGPEGPRGPRGTEEPHPWRPEDVAPGESAWWGYSAIEHFMACIEHAGAQEARAGTGSGGGADGDTGGAPGPGPAPGFGSSGCDAHSGGWRA